MIRFEDGLIPEFDRQKITSPDLKGFSITGATIEEAEREPSPRWRRSSPPGPSDTRDVSPAFSFKPPNEAMVCCVSFSDIEMFLLEAGFRLAGRTASQLLSRRVDRDLTVHRPNRNGDVTQIEFEQACDSASIAPPALDRH